jgi:hypothetical protein
MDIHELEETLARLPAINAVRIATDGDRVSEVHVLASPEKAPKQVVRDVQTLALARFGIDIDRRAVSVVQIGPGKLALGWHGEEYVGTATGPAAQSARLRLVGEASLRAIEHLLPGDALALDSIGAPAIGMKTVLVAVVVATGEAGEEITVGSALSSGDDSETAVRAVLDALNRRIGRPD